MISFVRLKVIRLVMDNKYRSFSMFQLSLSFLIKSDFSTQFHNLHATLKSIGQNFEIINLSLHLYDKLSEFS